MTLDKKEIRLTVGRALVVLFIVISGVATTATAWAVLSSRVEAVTVRVANSEADILRVEKASCSKDAAHTGQINKGIASENDLKLNIRALQEGQKYMILMLEDFKRILQEAHVQ